jgi:hypothetical protein
MPPDRGFYLLEWIRTNVEFLLVTHDFPLPRSADCKTASCLSADLMALFVPRSDSKIPGFVKRRPNLPQPLAGPASNQLHFAPRRKDKKTEDENHLSSKAQTKQVSIPDVHKNGMGQNISADEALDMLPLQGCFDHRAFIEDIGRKNEPNEIFRTENVSR